MVTGTREEPYLNYRFLVEIDGLIVGGYSEVTGLQAEVEIEEYQEGGLREFTHKLPKIAKFPNLVLKRGVTESEALWKWYENTVKGKIDRKSGRIILQDLAGREKVQWQFDGAYPVKWTGPELKGDGSNIAIEALELVHNGLRRG